MDRPPGGRRISRVGHLSGICVHHQAIAIRAGRTFGLSALQTYTLDCLFDLLVSAALTSWAIFTADASRLRSSRCALMLFGFVSDEVLLIPACFLLIAYVDRIMHENRPVRVRALLIGAALATLCINARPPYVGLLLLAFMPGLCF
ncbi:DUF2142 domain-containing protein [Caballeronia sp. ATUFL_F1_KS39]|uniref:DUF2142 domain-containing protein n=1 Tax=Caballeronia sp. ATUFL_F1_KS39 TaxID=2921766 RepID=UPI0025403AFD|nr:DUF2142 domain-containing protein [Caballeronia sp. ATUFL_F1_KS39]